MPHLPAHSTGVLAWLVAMVACAAHAEEAQEATIAPADQFKFIAARSTVGPFEFDIGAAYYYYPGEIGPDLSNYWESHVTMSHKLTEKLSWGPTIAYPPAVSHTAP